MKTLFLALALCASLPAFASEKTCTNNSNDSFKAEIAEHKLVVKDLSAGSPAWEGTFKRKSSDIVNGRDGNTYLDFSASGDEGCTEVLVDEALLKPRGKGLIKFRCRGEGFGQDVFDCQN